MGMGEKGLPNRFGPAVSTRMPDAINRASEWQWYQRCTLPGQLIRDVDMAAQRTLNVFRRGSVQPVRNPIKVCANDM